MLSVRCSSVSVSANHARPCCSTASLRGTDSRTASSRTVLCHGSHDGVSVLSSEHDNVEQWPTHGAEDSSKKAHVELLTQLIDSCASLQDVDAFVAQHGQELSPFAAARLALKVEGLLASCKHALPATQLSRVTSVIGEHVPSMGTVGLLHVLSLCATLPKTKRFSKLLDVVLLHLTPASASNSHLYLRHLVHLFLASSGMALQASPQAQGKLHDLANYAAVEVVSALETASIRDAVLTAKILSSFRHGKKVPSATLRPVLTALAAHTERSLLEYNATQLMITLSCLRVCGGASASLYKAVGLALESGRLGHLTARHQVTILHVFDSAGQQLPTELRHRLVTCALADMSLLTNPGDVAKLAQATAVTPTVSPSESMPIAEYVVRNAAHVSPSVTTTCVAALLSLGCVHEGAIAAFKGAAVPRLNQCRPWQMMDAAFCAAHPSCAEVWPQVRAAAAAKGSGAEISTTTQYLEALLSLTGSLESWSSSLATGSAQHDQRSSLEVDNADKSAATAAADARALAQLLNDSAAVDASLRTAAAAACTALAPRAPLGPLAGLVNALRHAGLSRQQDCEALSHTCVCIEREILLRASPDSAAPIASILFSLVCMGHVPSCAQAASLARTLRPRFASLRPKAAVQLLWALGRCGHADSSLLRTLLKRMQALQAKIRASSSSLQGPAQLTEQPHRASVSDELETLATDVHSFTEGTLKQQDVLNDSDDNFPQSEDAVAHVRGVKPPTGGLDDKQVWVQRGAEESFDRDAAATFATGIPWALASCGAAHPQGLAASAATRAADLVLLVPELLQPLPLVHVSSFLWGMAVVRPPAAREAVRCAFQVLVAAVPPTAHDAHLPGAPRPTASPPPSSDPDSTACDTHRANSHPKSRRTITVDEEHTGLSAAGERLFGSKPAELSALEAMDWVNVLYASARFNYRNTWLLRKALMELTADSCAPVRALSVSRTTDLADALGNLRLYSAALTAALTQRFTAALTTSKPHVDPHQVATWLFMHASLRYYDSAFLDAVSAYAARHQDARFRSLSALSTALWAHARLGAHPSRFLDLCQLSASELLPVGNPGSPVTLQVQTHVIRIAWSLAVLKEWEHPLFRMALNTLSIAQQPPPPHSNVRTDSQDTPSLAEAPVEDLYLDSESSGSGMAAEAGIEDPANELQASPNTDLSHQAPPRTAERSERSSNDELTRRGAPFRGATGHDRKAPLRRLPAFSVLQLVQCMLLASAGGKTELLAMLPEELRVSCGGAWKRAVERQCQEHQDVNGAPLPLGLVEGTIASSLTSLGCKFSLNTKTPDGLLRLDCLLHHRLIDGPPGMNFVALDIWKEDQVAQNCRHVLSRGDIRRRIAAARRVHLIPILWQEWRPVISDTGARTAFLQSKLRSAGLQVPFEGMSPSDTVDNSS